MKKLLLQLFVLLFINVKSTEICKEIWKMENNVNGNILYGVRLNLCSTDNLNLDKITIDSLALAPSSSLVSSLAPSPFSYKNLNISNYNISSPSSSPSPTPSS